MNTDPAVAEGQVETAGWSRDQMAQRVARDIPDGSYVNLGIGMPEKVVSYVPAGREVIYHTENGLLGMGAEPASGEADPELINAGKNRYRQYRERPFLIMH